MNYSPKKLDGGGDIHVPKMIENAAVVGCDLIELLWKDPNGQPRFSVAEVNGFEMPIVGQTDKIDFDNDDAFSSAKWVEGTVKFYPDINGRCWGYVYDTPNNREKLYNSFSNDWYRIVDKKIKDEIKAEAEAKEIATTPAEKAQILVKKTKREQEAEQHAKTLARKLEEMEQKKKELEKELALAKGEKMVHVEKRLKGVKIPDRDKFLNGEGEQEDANE